MRVARRSGHARGEVGQRNPTCAGCAPWRGFLVECARTPGCATGPRAIHAADFALHFTTRVPTAGRSTTRRFSGSGAMRACGCLNAAGASGLGASTAAPCPSRMRRTPCGRWTSSSTPRPTAAGQDRVHSGRTHPRMPRRPGRLQHHQRRPRRRAWRSATGRRTTTTADGTAPSATRPQAETAVGAGDGARLVGDLGGGPGHALEATPAGCCGCAGTGCRGRSGA